MAYRAITSDAVLGAASARIYANGQTTTLEVKNALRAAGFWATQDNVSDHMEYLAKQDCLAYELPPTLRYRIYTFPNREPEYYSESKGAWVKISEMHTCHIINALAKMWAEWGDGEPEETYTIPEEEDTAFGFLLAELAQRNRDGKIVTAIPV